VEIELGVVLTEEAGDWLAFGYHYLGGGEDAFGLAR
jgi:hypothetical protein